MKEVSLEERQRRSEALRQRWANMSVEERARRSEIARESALRQMADPAARALSAATAKATWKKRGYKPLAEMTPEIREKIRAKLKGTRRAYMSDPEKMAEIAQKHSDTNKRRFATLGPKNHELFRPEVRERAMINSNEERKTSPLRGKFETNQAAEEWHLRDPRGHEYHFDNLRHFIRTHRHLFTAQQLSPPTNPVDADDTKAYACLARLSPRNTHPGTTGCGGWSWVRYVGEPDPRLISTTLLT